jgi:hypothetical protein
MFTTWDRSTNQQGALLGSNLTGWIRLAAACGLVLGVSGDRAHGCRSAGNASLWECAPRSISCDDCLGIDTDTTLATNTSVGVLTIKYGVSLTVPSGVTLSVGVARGSGTLINYGTVTACGDEADFEPYLALEDASGALWRAGVGQTLKFNTNYWLDGNFVANTNGIIDVHTYTIITSGNLSYTGGTPCSHVTRGTGGVFSWSGGACY